VFSLKRVGQVLAVVTMVSLTFGSFGVVALAADEAKNDAAGNKDVKEEPAKKGPMRVDDLPKPIPKALKKMKEVGDDFGDAITRGAGKVGRATKKAIEGNGK
jgi:hypothetical protein